MTLAPELLQILVCPKCKGELEYRVSPEALVCHPAVWSIRWKTASPSC